MKNGAILKNAAFPAVVSDEVLKATALMYVAEALEKEDYESCAELIRLAKGFGAQQSEVSALIAESFKGKKPGGIREAAQQTKAT